jgi:membrane-associated protein
MAMTADELLNWVTRYDLWVYGLLMAYCVGKTGPLPMVAGFLGFGGALDIGLVVAVVLTGTLVGSQLRFAIGHAGAPWMFERFPRFAPWLALGAAAVDRYPRALLPVYRFAKGTFSLVGLGAGASVLPWRRFVLADACGALLWAGVSVGTGVFIGSLGAQVDPRWSAYVGLGLLATGILGAFVFGSYLKRVLLPHAESALAHARLRRGGPVLV